MAKPTAQSTSPEDQFPKLIPIQQDAAVQDHNDLGGVIQAEVDVEEEHLIEEAQVLEMDDNTDSDNDLPPPLIDDAAVHVPLFPNLQDIPQFQEVEEVQVEDLLGYVGQMPASAQDMNL